MSDRAIDGPGGILLTLHVVCAGGDIAVSKNVEWSGLWVLNESYRFDSKLQNNQNPNHTHMQRHKT